MDIMQLDCILVVDSDTRSNMKVNISDLIMYGVVIVDSLRDIDSSLLKDKKKVIMLEDFPKHSYNLNDIYIFSALYDIDLRYIGSDKVWYMSLAKICKTYNMEVTNLEYNQLYSVLYDDISLQKSYVLEEYNTSINNKLIKEIESTTESKEVNYLIEDYKTTKEELSRSVTFQDEVIFDNLCMANHVRVTEVENNDLYGSYAEILKSSKILNRVLKDYEVILSKDIYDKVPLASYSNKPMILYFKEYQELVHKESLIKTLFNMFRLQARLTCKVVQLFDNNGYMRERALPDYYKVLDNRYFVSDIISRDFIAKSGAYENLLGTLLENKYKIDLLIIVDSKIHNDSILLGSYINFNMCRNENMISKYGLRVNNTVVNNSKKGHKLSWNTVNLNKYSTEDERFVYLSSRESAQNIFNVVCNYYNIGGHKFE